MRISNAGQASLKASANGSGGGGASEEKVKRLQAKVGELTMDVELLNRKIDAMEAQSPLARRRSKR